MNMMIRGLKAEELPTYSAFYAYCRPDWVRFQLVKVENGLMIKNPHYYPMNIKDVPDDARFYPISNNNIILVEE